MQDMVMAKKNPVRIRAVAIVVHDGRVLLIHRRKNGKEFYVFPGGGVEHGETIEHAVLREVREETTCAVKIDKFLYHHVYDDGTEQFFYLCGYVSGEPRLGDSDEARVMSRDATQYYEPMWYDVAKLPQLLLYSLEIRDWLIEDLKTNFQSAPKEAKLNVSDLRQSL